MVTGAGSDTHITRKHAGYAGPAAVRASDVFGSSSVAARRHPQRPPGQTASRGEFLNGPGPVARAGTSAGAGVSGPVA